MNRAIELLYKRIVKSISEAEDQELRTLCRNNPELAEIARRLEDRAYINQQLARRRMVDWERPALDMKKRIGKGSEKSFRWIRIISAAAAVAVVSALIFFTLNRFTLSDPSTDNIAEIKEEKVKTIRPGTTYAYISSSDGQRRSLQASDSIATPTTPLLSHDKHPATVSKADTKKLCLDVPRGSEFKIVLEDSTEVWLNSESQLHYPERFPEHERRVSVTGEAYFSVKKDPERPFFVEVNKQIVRVYGTCFNIRSYNDDPLTYTTLESGKITLRKADGQGGELFLSPGNQAMFNPETGSVEMRTVDPTIITSWRKGRFVFEEQPLKNIMRDLARWYNFEYHFDDPTLEEIVFMGSIPRYAEFTTAIAILEKSGGIRFHIDGNKVTIHKKKLNKKKKQTEP